MVKKISRLLTALTLLGIVLMASGLLQGGAQSQQEKLKDTEITAELLQRKTMQEIAQERDVEFLSHPEIAEFSDLSSLARSSQLIVYGKIVKAESAFTESGQHIETTYSVDIHRVLKSDPRLELPLTFTELGGTVYTNGHKATEKVEAFDALKPDKNYLLFFEWSPNSKGYILGGGMSAVFRVKGNARVYSLATSKGSPLRENYNGTGLREFIDQVLTLQ